MVEYINIRMYGVQPLHVKVVPCIPNGNLETPLHHHILLRCLSLSLNFINILRQNFMSQQHHQTDFKDGLHPQIMCSDLLKYSNALTCIYRCIVWRAKHNYILIMAIPFYCLNLVAFCTNTHSNIFLLCLKPCSRHTCKQFGSYHMIC